VGQTKAYTRALQGLTVLVKPDARRTNSSFPAPFGSCVATIHLSRDTVAVWRSIQSWVCSGQEMQWSSFVVGTRLGYGNRRSTTTRPARARAREWMMAFPRYYLTSPRPRRRSRCAHPPTLSKAVSTCKVLHPLPSTSSTARLMYSQQASHPSPLHDMSTRPDKRPRFYTWGLMRTGRRAGGKTRPVSA
jgi:hypothetical protein